MKKNVFKMVMTLAIAVSVVSSIFMVSSAYGNVSNTTYDFYNMTESGNTAGRPKLDATKTYINPTSGPALTYTVQGYKNSTWSNRSSSHTINSGTEASFTNFVNENSESSARLHMERTTTAYTWTHGQWSPDSTRNYDVYY